MLGEATDIVKEVIKISPWLGVSLILGIIFIIKGMPAINKAKEIRLKHKESERYEGQSLFKNLKDGLERQDKKIKEITDKYDQIVKTNAELMVVNAELRLLLNIAEKENAELKDKFESLEKKLKEKPAKPA